MPGFFTASSSPGGPQRPLSFTPSRLSVGFSDPKIWKYLLLAVVVLYLLAPMRLPLVSASAQGVLLVVIFVAHLIFRRGRIDPALLLPSAFFFGPLTVAAVLSPNGYEIEYLRPLVLGGIASYLFAFHFRDPGSLGLFRIALILLFLIAGLSVVTVLAPHALAWLTPSFPLPGWMMEDPILFGLFLIVGHLGLVHLYLRTRGHLLLGPLLVTTLAVIATASRGIWAGTLCGTLVYLGLARAGRRGLMVLLSIVLAFVGFRILMEARIDAYVQSGGHAASEPPAVTLARDIEWKSTFSRKNREDLSLQGRVGMIVIGLRLWRSHPLLGVGPGKFQEGVAQFLPKAMWPAIAAADSELDPHNIYIAILTDAGAVGMIGFLGMLGVIVARAWRRRGEGRASGPVVNVLLASLIALNVVGLMHDVHLDRLWWIMLGLLHGQGTRG